MGRSVKKDVHTYSAGAWDLTLTKLFVYNGWNLIQEVDGSGTTEKSYVWGLDLSQSLQGAGGVGGLLSSIEHQASSIQLYCYDANGNVGQLIDAADGSVQAHYEYDPFGNTVYDYGALKDDNDYDISAVWVIARPDGSNMLHLAFDDSPDQDTLSIEKSFACHIKEASDISVYFGKISKSWPENLSVFLDKLNNFSIVMEDKPKILFICSKNKWRSPTAEQIYKDHDEISVRSAGLSTKGNRHVNEKDILWADLIIFMENWHKSKLMQLYRGAINFPRMEVLGILDEYDYMDEDLIEKIKPQVDYILNKHFDIELAR